MNRTAARNLARSLMDQHGLSGVPFEFDRGKTRLGATHFAITKRGRQVVASNLVKITLSGPYTDLLPEDEIRDVILHEIAHALAGHDHGHDYYWKSIARRIGCSAMRCAQPSERIAPTLVGMCAAGHTHNAHRHPLRVKLCNEVSCRRKPYAERMFRFFKDGRPATMPTKFRQEAMRHGLL